MIVVGSHGHGAIRRAVLGSVSQSVLRHARCSVRVARSVPRTDEGAPLRVLLGIDGSPAAAAALNAVSMRRWPAGTELRVVVAVDVQLVTAIPALMPDFNWTIPVGADELHAWPRQAAAAAVEELRRAGISAASIVRDGDPTQVLLEEADSHRAACIFLGARGHSRLESLLLGSVSASVAARANCSVEVVRFE